MPLVRVPEEAASNNDLIVTGERVQAPIVDEIPDSKRPVVRTG